MFRRLLKTRNDGSTVLEFAIVAPVLFLILIGFIEVGLVLFTSSVLEGATDIGARIGKTGFTADGLTADQYIRSRIDQLSGGYLDLSKLIITIQAYNSFQSIGNGTPCTTDPASPCANGPGTGGQTVLYRVIYPWVLFTPLMRQTIGDANGVINITAVATVRNEPF